MRIKLPDWTEEEIILLLDFHFRFRLNSFNQTNKIVNELSETLKYINRINETDIGIRKNGSFRSASSIIIKRRAFQEFDEKTARKTSHSKLDYKLWLKYHLDLDNLKISAINLRIKYNIPSFLKNNGHLLPICDENYEYLKIETNKNDEIITHVIEGKSKLRIHYFKERNSKIVKEKKLWAINKFGKLECEVCNFIFHEKYGEIGRDFIECHHLKPLALLKKQDITKIEDLALVCSNCHRMLHQDKFILDIDQLKNLISESDKSS